MMETLQEKHLSVAREYARQFGNIIVYDFEFWTGPCDGFIACFGDNYFFGLEDMAIVLDSYGQWMKIYNSREELGNTILEWYDFFSDIDHFNDRTIEGRPSINLHHWLLGARIITSKKP